MIFFAGTEYFVSLEGDDTNDGAGRKAAFRTVQCGVDALDPTIASGEYFEKVSREGLRSGEVDTVILAEIPGTVLLRGDVPAPAFRTVTCPDHRENVMITYCLFVLRPLDNTEHSVDN